MKRSISLNDFIFISNSSVTLIVLIAVLGGFFSDPKFRSHPFLIIPLAASGYLLSMSAIMFNNIFDEDIDSKMVRTKRKSEIVGKNRKFLFSVSILSLFLGLFIGFEFINIVSIALLAGGFLVYVVLYTAMLKRRTRSNILLGGIGGSLVALSGWFAVTSKFTWTPVYLAIFVLLWMPLTFWPFAILHENDYKTVGVPMLPSTLNEKKRRTLIISNSVGIFLFSLLPIAFITGEFLLVYGVVAAIMGAFIVISSNRLAPLTNGSRKVQTFLFFTTIYFVIMVIMLDLTQIM